MPKANAASSTDLSELEGGVLGIVHACPNSTAHVIREMFRGSRSSHWSGSAGAIYPLMKKLEGRGLLARMPDERDRRRHLVWLTPLGRELQADCTRVLATERVRAAFEHLSEPERTALLEGLAKLVRHHTDHAGKPGAPPPRNSNEPRSER